MSWVVPLITHHSALSTPFRVFCVAPVVAGVPGAVLFLDVVLGAPARDSRNEAARAVALFPGAFLDAPGRDSRNEAAHAAVPSAERSHRDHVICQLRRIGFATIHLRVAWIRSPGVFFPGHACRCSVDYPPTSCLLSQSVPVAPVASLHQSALQGRMFEVVSVQQRLLHACACARGPSRLRLPYPMEAEAAAESSGLDARRQHPLLPANRRLIRAA